MIPRHPLFVFCLVVALAAVVPTRGAQDDGFADLPKSSETRAAPTSAPALLRECIAHLPTRDVRLTGWVRNRRPRGIVDVEFQFEALLQWGAAVPTVQYSFTTPKGATMARATFCHEQRGTDFVLEEGADLVPAETPVWNAPILGTDVTWLDISMDFLHWERAELAGETTLRGRLCDIVEVYPPEEIPGCLKVRLLVDREIRMFLQAQQVDEERKVARQMWVRSVKKMDDRWMVQDLEVEARGSGHRTRLHVLSCE
jgi:hypothetical protein